MLFNSFEFLFFLPVVFCLYWFVLNKSLSRQNALILVASYFFYGWWSYKFLGLLALSTLLDYSYGFGVASPNRKKARLFFWLSIINNLGILAVFKYYNFFALEFKAVLGLIGISVDPLLLSVALPIGISFYTFHGMSYVFDIYRGRQKPITNFIDYAVFVSFFPLLVAGPIERANHLLPQVQSKRYFDYKQAVQGITFIVWGLFKKVVIADNIASTVNIIFRDYHDLNAFSLIVGAVAFSFQIYCDFSGYSDIALGTARLFGFELLSNFKFPYFSRDVAEFWRRWHVSLSSWFRDYLYIPLGGSREGRFKAVRNTFIIFLVSGFWHGASWNFIIWGFVHACGFLPLLLLQRNRKHVTDVVAQNRKLPTIREVLQMFSTFVFVTFAWIFFRAETISISLEYISRIADNALHNPKQFLSVPSGSLVFLYIIPLVVGDWMLRRNEREYRIPLLLLIVLATISLLNLFATMGDNISFIYFQF